jgi:glutathione S-transferase
VRSTLPQDPPMELVIGNKNYSSWSMRAWVLLRQSNLPFEEVRLRFGDPAFKAKVLAYSPAGRVPVLIDGPVTVWDSLAIAEYVAERHPALRLWPADVHARARARAICAEMHAGFAAMRSRLPLNCELELRLPLDREVQRDVDRILKIWHDCRAANGAAGPFRFGAFTIADAYFAPVTQRFRSYGVTLPDQARSYVETIERLPALQAWLTEARAEHDFVPEDEPYRDPPARAEN